MSFSQPFASAAPLALLYATSYSSDAEEGQEMMPWEAPHNWWIHSNIEIIRQTEKVQT
jgi:hypothetical protein